MNLTVTNSSSKTSTSHNPVPIATASVSCFLGHCVCEWLVDGGISTFSQAEHLASSVLTPVGVGLPSPLWVLYVAVPHPHSLDQRSAQHGLVFTNLKTPHTSRGSQYLLHNCWLGIWCYHLRGHHPPFLPRGMPD